MTLEHSKISRAVELSAEQPSCIHGESSRAVGYSVRRVARTLATGLCERFGSKIHLTEDGKRLLRVAAGLVDRPRPHKQEPPY